MDPAPLIKAGDYNRDHLLRSSHQNAPAAAGAKACAAAGCDCWRAPATPAADRNRVGTLPALRARGGAFDIVVGGTRFL